MTTVPAADTGVARRPLWRREFDALVATGAFEGERVELLGGELIEMSPQGSRHSWIVERLAELLTLALAGRYSVRAQLPFALSDDSEPEPDIAVTDRTSPEAHPSSAHLIVEVAETSLNLDLVHKTPRYASAGVAEYWVVDVPAQQIVVHQDPTPGAYRQIRRVGRDSTLTVLGVTVQLSDFLPET